MDASVWRCELPDNFSRTVVPGSGHSWKNLGQVWTEAHRKGAEAEIGFNPLFLLVPEVGIEPT